MFLLWHWIELPNDMISPTLRRFSWGVAGGSLTGLQNFLKDGLTVLKASDTPPLLFLVLITGAGLSAFGGLLILTQCMKRYDTTYSAAMFVGSFVVSASIMSAIHYDTFQHLTAWVDFVCYPAGLVLLMVGVVLLARHDDDDNPHSDDSLAEFSLVQDQPFSEEPEDSPRVIS